MTEIPYRLIGGIAGALLALGATVWLVQSRSYWKDQAGAEQAAHKQTVTNYQTAAKAAKLADAANKVRVQAEQLVINERTANEYQARITDARARYERLRPQAGTVASGPVSPSVPRVSPSASGTPGPAAQGELFADDALTATEQAIQLDELVRWVNAQSAVNLQGTDEHPAQ